MKRKNDFLRLSASDLSNHLNCSYITTLDYRVAMGEMESPKWRDPDAIVLQQLGYEHERRYLNHLAQRGLAVRDLRKVESDLEAAEETLAAMKKGIAVIAQPTLSKDRWLGRADVLIRVETASDLGAWSYEVYDCKLARETKGATILQLSLYSELVAAIQGVTPQFMCVVSPSETFAAEKFNVLEYAAYYRLVKARLEQAVDIRPGVLTSDAEPNAHCDVCRWWQNCDAQWRRDDHLSLVAGISRLQRKQLRTWEIDTMTRLASLALPLKERPDYGSKEGYVRVREQARLQVTGREEKRSIHEIFDNEGLARLPAPSAGDIFFDLEGDAFVGTSGLEYLFGLTRAGQSGAALYECRWSYTPAEENQAFEWFVDLVMQAWSENPDMHVYHFSAREPAALKRLMGRYATREDAVDRMLRGGLLVDLHRVLKQSVRASVEEYSLKALEVFHNFARATAIAEARTAMRIVEHSLELGREERIDESIRLTVQSYNREDCLSTSSLRQWLEQQRSELILQGQKIARPVMKDSEPSAALDERQQRVAALFGQLTKDVLDNPAPPSEEQSARWLLANLLDWHRREEKAEGQEYYRLKEMPEEELLYERSALFGLEYIGRIQIEDGISTDRYRFEQQDTNIRAGNTLYDRDEKIGQVIAIDLIQRFIDIEKTRKFAELHPRSVVARDTIRMANVCKDSLINLATWILANGADSPGRLRSARDLLLRRTPRLAGDATGLVAREDEELTETAKRVALSLDESILPIQGPPGSGKTFTGAKIICELVRRGKKVGITALPHRVIKNLFEEVLVQAKKENLQSLACLHKVNEKSKIATVSDVKETLDNKKVLQSLKDGSANVVGGTAWLWSREDMFESVDVLVVDEAGQMSLANVLASAQSAKSLVLLGDPRQLDQPLRGSHPDGADISALGHLLGKARTIRPEQGLFLEQTRRLHPSICRFTSESFYDNILRPLPGLEEQVVLGHPFLGGSGLCFVSVKHEANQNASAEEADVIQALVNGLLHSGVQWFNVKLTRPGFVPLMPKDILIIAPYNAQVSDISVRLPEIRVGTVDKFQGQEAAIVIYSLTTSSQEDAPRGMEFLYSLNRLNVATSRGRALCIVVGSPRLLEPQCRTPRQMQLANALCRFAELAQRIEVSDARGRGYEFIIVPAA